MAPNVALCKSASEVLSWCNKGNNNKPCTKPLCATVCAAPCSDSMPSNLCQRAESCAPNWPSALLHACHSCRQTAVLLDIPAGDRAACTIALISRSSFSQECAAEAVGLTRLQEGHNKICRAQLSSTAGGIAQTAELSLCCARSASSTIAKHHKHHSYMPPDDPCSTPIMVQHFLHKALFKAWKEVPQHARSLPYRTSPVLPTFSEYHSL